MRVRKILASARWVLASARTLPASGSTTLTCTYAWFTSGARANIASEVLYAYVWASHACARLLALAHSYGSHTRARMHSYCTRECCIDLLWALAPPSWAKRKRVLSCLWSVLYIEGWEKSIPYIGEVIWAKLFEGETEQRVGLMGCLGSPRGRGWERDVSPPVESLGISLYQSSLKAT